MKTLFKGKILTIPNLLSLIRILLIPLFVWLYLGEENVPATAVVLVLYLTLILRLIYLSERQSFAFGRIFGYSVLCILLFHVFINIGMVIGLTPVIGIPLPFFSYGGSSLWGFTILLFVFLRIDAARKK